MTGDGLAPTDRSDMLAGLGLDVHRRLDQPEQPGQVARMAGFVRPELGLLGVNDHVAVDRAANPLSANRSTTSASSRVLSRPRHFGSVSG